MRELIEASEVYEMHTPERIGWRVLWREDDEVYHALAVGDSYSVDSITNGERIPLEKLYTPLPPLLAHFKRAPEPISNDSYVKSVRLSLYAYADNRSTLDWSAKILAEAVVLEALAKQAPHPNLCEYCGVVLDKRERVVGLALKRYGPSLIRRIMAGTVPITAVEDIRAALDHMHSLGFCHNDISPGNVVFDTDDRAVLIDFGASTTEGARLQDGVQGTPSYTYYAARADRRWDLWQLGLLERCIADGGQGEARHGVVPKCDDWVSPFPDIDQVVVNRQ